MTTRIASPRDRPTATSGRLLVLGAGPIGLDAALAASQLGYDVRVLESDRVGANIRAWGQVRMFSPWNMNCSADGLRQLVRHGFAPWTEGSSCPTGDEYVRRYLEPLAALPPLKGRIVTGTRVVSIGRAGLLKGERIGDPARGARPFRVLTRGAGGEAILEADLVIDATGTFANPRNLGEGGIPAPGERAAASRIEFRPIDARGAMRKRYAGRRILLIGGGYSAATSAVALAALVRSDPKTSVIWAVRSAGTAPLRRFSDDPLPARDDLAKRANAIARSGSGRFETIRGATVTAIAAAPSGSRRGRSGGVPLVVTLDTPVGRRRARFDRIVANVGYRPDRTLYEELQVHECYATGGPYRLAAALLGERGGAGDCLAQPAATADTLTTTEPGFYILGCKSYGRNPDFLLRNGFEQVRSLFAGPNLRGRIGLEAASRGSGRRAGSRPGRGDSGRPEART